jgi:hypothetical protein
MRLSTYLRIFIAAILGSGPAMTLAILAYVGAKSVLRTLQHLVGCA